MKVYPISENGPETREFKADGDGRYALVCRIKNQFDPLEDTTQAVIMNLEEVMNLYQAISEEILK